MSIHYKRDGSIEITDDMTGEKQVLAANASARDKEAAFAEHAEKAQSPLPSEDDIARARGLLAAAIGVTPETLDAALDALKR